MKRHAATLAAGLLACAVAPTLYAQANRVAVVDLSRAVAQTEDGRREMERLKRWAKRHQDAIDEQQEAAKQLKLTYDRQEKLWTTELRARKATELQKAAADLQTKFVELQRELAQRESRMTGPILQRMQRILRRLGQSDGYALILDRNQAGVVWVPSNLDLTDDLIQRYNAGEGREGERPAPAERRRRRRRRAAD